MKKLVLLLLLVSFQVSFTYGQACGGSIRTISLKFEANKKTPKKVSYELFYLAPKNTGAGYNDYERDAKFLSQFLYDDPKAKTNMFWGGYDDKDPFVTVPAEKAEKYIETYKLEDFKDFYTNKWHDNHLSQLEGKFEKGTLRLETRETDITPFIMRIKAKKYETLYLLSSFLGGCFEGKPAQTVQMKPIKK
jgi:hypothetical protein